MRKITFTIILLILLSKLVSAQDFYSSYKHYISTHSHANSKSLNRSIKMMQDAFSKYQSATKKSILEKDTLFMVSYYTTETAHSRNIIWNRLNSLCYEYDYKKMLSFETDASDWVKGYKSEFKKWVETADTSSYNKYGKLSSWFDAPWVSFTVAIKNKDRWDFIQSASYSNNIDKLN